MDFNTATADPAAALKAVSAAITQDRGDTTRPQPHLSQQAWLSLAAKLAAYSDSRTRSGGASLAALREGGEMDLTAQPHKNVAAPAGSWQRIMRHRGNMSLMSATVLLFEPILAVADGQQPVGNANVALPEENDNVGGVE